MKDAPGAHDTLMGRREVVETANGAMRACRAWEFLEHAGVRSSRERMELRLGKERQPILTIDREKTGALRFQIHTPELPPPPITTPLEKALLHAELPDPESPYWVPGDIQRLLRECLAAALKHAISQDAGGMLPNPESLNHEIIMEEDRGTPDGQRQGAEKGQQDHPGGKRRATGTHGCRDSPARSGH